MLYGRRMDMQGRSKETGLNLLSTLTGASWRQCEDLDLAELGKETGLKTISMPEAFEKYFYKTSRQQGQTMLTYCTEAAQALQDLTKYQIVIPDEVAVWLLMRRAGLTREQRQLVQTTVDVKTKVADVEKALYLTLGQDHVMGNPGPRHQGSPMLRWRQDRVHFAEESEWGDETAYAADEADYDD